MSNDFFDLFKDHIYQHFGQSPQKGTPLPIPTFEAMMEKMGYTPDDFEKDPNLGKTVLLRILYQLVDLFGQLDLEDKETKQRFNKLNKQLEYALKKQGVNPQEFIRVVEEETGRKFAPLSRKDKKNVEKQYHDLAKKLQSQLQNPEQLSEDDLSKILDNTLEQFSPSTKTTKEERITNYRKEIRQSMKIDMKGLFKKPLKK